jgi:hypothetical protein
MDEVAVLVEFWVLGGRSGTVWLACWAGVFGVWACWLVHSNLFEFLLDNHVLRT